MSWKFQTAVSIESPDASVRSLGWGEAQAWCNFVLMYPSFIPDDLALEKSEIRPEAPPGRPTHTDQRSRPDWTRSNRAAHRAEYVGRDRRLRIKQFLYDYAPRHLTTPAFGKAKTLALLQWGVSSAGWALTSASDKRRRSVLIAPLSSCP
jgi:hypothetical protein